LAQVPKQLSLPQDLQAGNQYLFPQRMMTTPLVVKEEEKQDKKVLEK